MNIEHKKTIVKIIEKEGTPLYTEENFKGEYRGVVVVDAPLLFECNMQGIGDENWLVSVDLDIRISRVMARDGLTKEQIMSRINNQMSQEDKEKLSHVILNNSGSLEELYEQIDMNLERIRNEF